MAKTVIEFKRGDGVTHYFKLPLDAYSPGAALYFTAKPAIDNDSNDSAAVINKMFTDANVDLVSEAGMAVYTLSFVSSDTSSIIFASGETEKDYLGEFSYVVPGQSPVSFPANNNYISVKVYADIKRAS